MVTAMTADQLLAEATADIDREILAGAMQVAQAWLDRGARPDDLPRVMRDFVHDLATWRAHAIARVHVRAERISRLEARMAGIERQTATVTVSVEVQGGRVCRGAGTPQTASVSTASHTTLRLNV